MPEPTQDRSHQGNYNTVIEQKPEPTPPPQQPANQK